jgi:hypothetical protein
VREEFKQWLGRQSYTAKTLATQWAQASRLEKHYGDLDAAYDADRLSKIRTELEYSKEDERSGRVNPSKFEIKGDLYANLAGYRATLTYYSRFREAEAGGAASTRTGRGLNTEALERLKQAFLTRYPDFASLGFQAGNGGYWDEERAYKEQVLSGAKVLLAEQSASDEKVGQAMIDLLQRPPANFVGWRAFAHIKDAGPVAAKAIATALGEMLNDPDDVATIAARSAETIHPLMMGGTLGNPAFGQVRSLVTTALALARPDEAIAVKTRYMQRAAKLLTGRGPFKAGVMTSGEYREITSIAEAIFAVMRDDWKWKPRDLWDVQGFLWATSQDPEEAADEDEDHEVMAQRAPVTRPTNLILYGPPGTGKTYVTAEKAVRLCDGEVPSGGRQAVMQRYSELVDRKRISFVTFHQSYAYEDFVEGLRPETSSLGQAGEEEDNNGSGGFTLKPQAGVFRRIAELARENRGHSAKAPKLDRTRQVFKMSLGRGAEEEGARLFREAIDGNYVVLGWGGEVDWSGDEYSDFNAIKARWQKDHPEATGHDANITQLYTLRSAMTVGDLIIISDGNKRFRAIAQVEGPYKFVLGDSREYNHRRPVRWLWHNVEGHPRELIYNRGFSQVAMYQLDSTQINWSALEQIISGSGKGSEISGEPEPYVLIIDEINRANISKVFGELITLIETDKRLGRENALTVTLPYSGDTFGVPANLHIIGTMNTADRSIALLDTALRRRFEFEEQKPDPSLLIEASNATGVDLSAVLTGLNARIEYLFDRDHQIGHAFFMECKNIEDLNKVMRTKVIPLLAEYFYENWEKVRQVLGETTDQGNFVSRTKLQPPNGSEAFVSEDGRWRYQAHAVFAPAAYEQLKT